MLPTHPTIKVIIADDHPFFREGFKTALQKQHDIAVIAEAASGEELCSLVEKHQPDVVITDINMPGLDGIAAARHIQEHFPQTGIIALSMHDGQGYVESMLNAGARAYLLKDSHVEEITEAIKIVHRGSFHSSRATAAVWNKVMKDRFTLTRKVTFTPREIEIIRLICEEKTSKEIANQLRLHERTVEDHRNHIQKKIKARNMAGIVVYAIKNEIFHPN
jgi:DNA-binding NarL/FixJ family response regulator